MPVTVMATVAKGPIAKGLPNSNRRKYKKPSITGKPRDVAVNSVVATAGFSNGGL